MSKSIKFLVMVTFSAAIIGVLHYLWSQDTFGFKKQQEEMKAQEKIGYELGLLGKSGGIPFPQSWSKQQAFMDGLSRGYAEYEIKRLQEIEYRRQGYEAGLAGREAVVLPPGEFQDAFLAEYNKGHTEFWLMLMKRAKAKRETD